MYQSGDEGSFKALTLMPNTVEPTVSDVYIENSSWEKYHILLLINGIVNHSVVFLFDRLLTSEMMFDLLISEHCIIMQCSIEQAYSYLEETDLLAT